MQLIQRSDAPPPGKAVKVIGTMDLRHAHAFAAHGLENREEIGNRQQVADLFIQVDQQFRSILEQASKRAS
jgi:hypothetical protein